MCVSVIKKYCKNLASYSLCITKWTANCLFSCFILYTYFIRAFCALNFVNIIFPLYGIIYPHIVSWFIQHMKGSVFFVETITHTLINLLVEANKSRQSFRQIVRERAVVSRSIDRPVGRQPLRNTIRDKLKSVHKQNAHKKLDAAFSTCRFQSSCWRLVCIRSMSQCMRLCTKNRSESVAVTRKTRECVWVRGGANILRKASAHCMSAASWGWWTLWDEEQRQRREVRHAFCAYGI